MFNIEHYLDSLPEDIEEIYVSHRHITKLDVSRFKNLQKLHCSDSRISYLHLNANLRALYCYNNHLACLHLNENLETLYCENNHLTSLHLNKNLQLLNCSGNELTSLHLNEKLETLSCSGNDLTSLHLNEKLKTLNCSHNQLTCLHLNKKVEILNCSFNQLNYLYLNEQLERIAYHNNPIYEIINGYDANIVKQRMRILNQFRYFYYCLKFKKQLRDWLWVKIREPKIIIKYSHAYLLEHLHEDTDLDELLDNW